MVSIILYTGFILKILKCGILNFLPVLFKMLIGSTTPIISKLIKIKIPWSVLYSICIKKVNTVSIIIVYPENFVSLPHGAGKQKQTLS